MMVRMWHEMVDVSKADDYTEFMKERAAPDYGSVEGLKKILFLRNVEKDVAHFPLSNSLGIYGVGKKFSGVRPDKAKYYPEDDNFLLEKEATPNMRLQSNKPLAKRAGCRRTERYA